MMALGVRPTVRRFYLGLRCVLLGHADPGICRRCGRRAAG